MRRRLRPGANRRNRALFAAGHYREDISSGRVTVVSAGAATARSQAPSGRPPTGPTNLVTERQGSCLAPSVGGVCRAGYIASGSVTPDATFADMTERHGCRARYAVCCGPWLTRDPIRARTLQRRLRSAFTVGSQAYQSRGLMSRLRAATCALFATGVLAVSCDHRNRSYAVNTMIQKSFAAS